MWVMGFMPSTTALATSGQRLPLQQLRAAIQAGQGTLVAGTFTVSAGIELTATSRILLTLAATPTGSTDFAGLAVTTTTPGAPGTASMTVQAIVAAGTIDADAAGAVDYLIIG